MPQLEHALGESASTADPYSNFDLTTHVQCKGLFGGFKLPEVGWAKQAVENQQPQHGTGMRSQENLDGIHLQGWDEQMGSLYAFAHFNFACDSCDQILRASGPLDVYCKSPAFESALAGGLPFEDAKHLICHLRSPSERCYALELLASLAQNEDWDCKGEAGQPPDYLGCLRFYLNNHFLRLVEQGKVLQCFDENAKAIWTCFCTGLLSKNEESVYCILQRSSFELTTPWQYYCFVTLRELQDLKQPWNLIQPLLDPPEKATFIDGHLDLVYSPSVKTEGIQIDPQIWNELDERVLCFPKGGFPEIGVMPLAQKQALLSAMQRAVQALHYNPFIAVPQYQPSLTCANVQLLLPLKLDPTSETVNAALVLEVSKSRRGGRTYRASKVIPLEQAYANARILMPVHQPWLAKPCSTKALVSDADKVAMLQRLVNTQAISSTPSVHYNLTSQGAAQRVALSNRGGVLSLQLPTTRRLHRSSTLPGINSASFLSKLSLQCGGSVASSSSHVGSSCLNSNSHHSLYNGGGQALCTEVNGCLSPAFSRYRDMSCHSISDSTSMLSSTKLSKLSSYNVSRLADLDGISPEIDAVPSLKALGLLENERQMAELNLENTSNNGGYSMLNIGSPTWSSSPQSPSSPTLPLDLHGCNNNTSYGLLTDNPFHQSSSSILCCNFSSLARLSSASINPFSWAYEISTGSSSNKQDEFIEFTPADDACPKVNISALPPRFVADFLSGEQASEQYRCAEEHAQERFTVYGPVARCIIRENKNHTGKWFAIIEFKSWTDDEVREKLVSGCEVRFTNFYESEDVLIRRHKDKHNKFLRTPLSSLPAGSPCRPEWIYTGLDTKAGKPLYKGPCTVCGRESTVPFKPVVNGQPPKCRNCLPCLQSSSPLLPSSSSYGHQSLALLATGLLPTTTRQQQLLMDSSLYPRLHRSLSDSSF